MSELKNEYVKSVAPSNEYIKLTGYELIDLFVKTESYISGLEGSPVKESRNVYRIYRHLLDEIKRRHISNEQE